MADEFYGQYVPSEVDLQQARVRLIRLDAEGNPVGEAVDLNGFTMFEFAEPETVEDRLQEYLTQKTVTMEFQNIEIDEEVKRLVFGEDYDRVVDSGSDRRWYHALREAVRGLLAKMKVLFRS